VLTLLSLTFFEKSVSIAQLMGMKFYLNKFAKVDNLENYTWGTVLLLNKEYTDFLEKTEGTDPDFPGIDFTGGAGGKKIAGVNAARVQESDDNNNDII